MYSFLIHGKTGNSDWKIKWFAPFCMESFRNYGLWFVFLCKRFPPRWYGKHARYFPGNVFLLLFVSLSFCFQHSYHKVMQCLWWGLCSCSNHWQFNTVHQAYSDVIIMSWLVCRVKPHNRALKIRQWQHQQERQKNSRCNQQISNFAYFYSYHCVTAMWKCLISHLMENINKWQQNVLPSFACGS